MKFDISRRIDRLIDPKTPLYRRAINLYELQCAILACRGPADSSSEHPNRLRITVKRGLHVSARALATLKLLQHAAGPSHDKETSKARLRALIQDDAARELLDDLIFRRVGLARVRYAMRPRQFSKRQRVLIVHATCVRAVADFSIRFERVKGKKEKGGRTAAAQVISEDRGDGQTKTLNQTPIYPDVERKLDSILDYCKRFEPVIPLIWIGRESGDILTPPPIHKKSFAKKLLSQASRTDELRRLATTYDFVCSRLKERRYKCTPLGLQTAVESVSLPLRPLERQLIDLMN